MSSVIDDGGAAFPQPGVYHPDHGVMPVNAFYDAGGMSLRDAFAIAALQGWAAGRNNGDEFNVVSQSGPDFVATSCYAYADAMIKAREVKP